MIIVNDRVEYFAAVWAGGVPLMDMVRYKMDISLRIEMQREIFGLCLFGRGNIPEANSRFYRWVWDRKKHYCEECLRPLLNYSAAFVSHILTRGAHPEMAHDPRNVNILCVIHHNQWETGNRKAMRIFPGNQRIIETLKKDYQ